MPLAAAATLRNNDNSAGVRVRGQQPPPPRSELRDRASRKPGPVRQGARRFALRRNRPACSVGRAMAPTPRAGM